MTDRTPGPTQQTQPKKGRPIEIPVPTRQAIDEAFERLARASDPDDPKRSGARP